MRCKYIISAAVIAAAASLTAVTVSAATENNSVSGYVSLTEGHKIVGYETSLYLQYGTKEDKSVVRAIGDLAADIEAVTDKKIGMAANDDFLAGALPPHGIVYDLYGPMCVFTYDAVPADSVCYVAAYNSDGSLNAVAQASKTYYTDEDGDTTIFEFENALERPEWGSMKAFVWDNNMKPIIDEQLDIEERSSTLFIGTLGAGGLVDDYFAQRNEAIASLEGKHESFTIQEVNGKLVIAGSDKRGTIYGIYDLCEKMGVSPWKFWADVEPEKAEELYINLPEGGYTEGEPSVEYRGIFLNDEYNLNQWTNDDFASNMNNEKYEKIYELILRLKMNTLWPAMHQYSTAFHNVSGAAELADEYGIVIGSSHAEPLLRNNLGELNDYQDKWEKEHPDKPLYKALKNETANYPVAYYWTDNDKYENGVAVGNTVYNKEFLMDYWRDSVKTSGQYDNIYTLGMRGVHDGSFQTNMNYETALKEIIAAQIQILEDELVGEGKKYSKIEDVPMVFIPYKDVLTYYNKEDRLNLPEYVTIMWTDDNYGYMRQNSNETERENSGGGGVYYHISYYGWPTSYLWLSSTQPALIREQLTRSYEMGAQKMWILNVGDLKPAEKEIEYYAKLSRDVYGMNKTDISDIYTRMAKRDFNMNDTYAAEYADIMDTYYELANSKRPEFYRTNDADNKLNISVTAYGDEGERYINRYKNITERAEALYEKLPDYKKPSFFELALYPIRSAKNMAVDFIQSDHAALYNEQGRYGAVNALSGEANAAAMQIEDDTSTYNTMLSGKWNNMMVINPSHFSSCDARLTTELNPPEVTELDFTDIGIAVNGEPYDRTQEITLSKYSPYNQYIDIYNTGYGSFDYTIEEDIILTPDAGIKFYDGYDYLEFSKTSGTVSGNDRVYFRVKPDAVIPAGVHKAYISVTAKINGQYYGNCTIEASIVSDANVPDDEKLYIESNSTVSIEAEHYTRLTDNGIYKWQVEKDFARSGDSLKIYPNLSDDVTNTAADMKADSATAEYDVYFTEAGTYNVSVYRMPTLNERGACRVGIGIDDGDPVSIGGTNAYPSSSGGTKTKTASWPNNVLKNCEILKTTVTVDEEGIHTIKLYNVSSGMAIDKIVLVNGTAPYSYFGAPESYNTTYNYTVEKFPTYIDDTTDEGIEKTFEPDGLIGCPISYLGEIYYTKLTDNYDSAVMAVVCYDENGNITSVKTKQIDLSNTEINSSINMGYFEHDYGAAAAEIIVFDNYTNLEPIAPVYRYGSAVSEAENSSMRVNADLTEYIGKKSIVLISDTEITEDITNDHIKYLYAEDITNKSYNSIPFADNAEGVYYIRVGIDGESPIDETRSTIINITPDNDGAPVYEYKEDFENSYDTSAWIKGSGSSTISVESGDSKYLKLAATTGTTGAYTNLSNAVDASARKVYIGADIMFTAPTGSSLGNSQLAIGNAYSQANFSSSNIDWGIINTSAGHIIVFEYNEGKTLTVNGQSLSTDFIGKWAHIETLVNFKTHTMDITLSADGVTDAKFTGVHFYSSSYTDTIGGLYARAAKANGTTSIDNFGVYTLSAPQYAINITAVDADNNAIDGALITVTSPAGATITAETSGEFEGKYMLAEGTYEITAAANGYTTKTETLELTPSLDSKNVKIVMSAE